MKASELRTKTNAELANQLDDSYQELFNSAFSKSIGAVD